MWFTIGFVSAFVFITVVKKIRRYRKRLVLEKEMRKKIFYS